MRKFRGMVGIGLQGRREFEFEVEDDADENTIADEAFNAAVEYLDYGFEEVE